MRCGYNAASKIAVYEDLILSLIFTNKLNSFVINPHLCDRASLYQRYEI